MRRCLITGATGLIGTHLTGILGADWEISCVSRAGGVSGVGANARAIAVDLSTDWSAKLLPDRIDAVVHLAQSEKFREFPEYAENVFNVNTRSTLKLLDYARGAGAKTFICASSGGIYGTGDEGFREDAAIAAKGDLGFYLGTKLCSEILAENYVPYLNVIILRFFFVYGPGQRKDMLIPRLVRSVRSGIPVRLDGEDGLRINPVYVTDAAAAIERALPLDGSHKINIGGPEVMSLRAVAEAIGGELGIEPVFEIVSGAPPRSLIGDIRKMSGLLAEPKVAFKEGIKKYIEALND